MKRGEELVIIAGERVEFRDTLDGRLD